MKFVICMALVVLIAVTQIRAGDFDESSISQSSQSSSNQQSSSSNGDGPPVIESSSSHSSGTVTQKCKNGVCMTCVDKKCFQGGNYTKVNAASGCPVCVCTKSCNKVVTGGDGCPMCSCKDGNGIREPCNDVSDCPKNATNGCVENACGYSGVPKDSEIYKSCAFDFNCPSGYQCIHAQCRKGGPEHGTSACVFDNQCDDNERCMGMTCIRQ